jgi:hypothetical protein
MDTGKIDAVFLHNNRYTSRNISELSADEDIAEIEREINKANKLAVLGVKYILRDSTFGFYKGRNQKYSDMVDFTSREYAKRFPCMHEAIKTAKWLSDRDYEVFIFPA